jgi:hypothetical protein
VGTLDKDLAQLEAELKHLEAEYNMYFAGRLPKPPWETRALVDSIVKRIDRTHVPNTGDRFRFTTLQSRYAAFVDLWDRGLRAREEGRAGPFPTKRVPVAAEPAQRGPEDKILHVASFHDPVREIEKLTELYESMAEARREVGEAPPPFHKFAELVKGQVKKLRNNGSPEVAFRVAVKDGKVSFTAKALKGSGSD